MGSRKTTIFEDLKSSTAHKDTQGTETTKGWQLKSPRGQTHNSVLKHPRTRRAAKLKGLFSIDSQQHICMLQPLCLSRQDGPRCYHETKRQCLDALTYFPLRIEQRDNCEFRQKLKMSLTHTGHVDISILRRISGFWGGKPKGKQAKLVTCEWFVSRAGLRVCRAAETAWGWDYT